ncbi:hypothetical protein CDD83_6850 [Cordyceps sp. RAO-2017]|nr:hypothetical protein CDD83_6850 [Cordyceps sp. RAO-2017]
MASARNQQQRQPSPSGSLTASALAEEEAIIDNDDNDADNDADNDVAGASMSYQARRRSSVGHRFAAMADLGGANSFRSFARSWRRAANFPEVIPRQPSFVLSPDQGSTTGDEVQYFSYRGPHEPPSQHTSLLAQHFGRLPSPEGEPSAGGPGLSPARDIPSGREGKALEAEMAVGALPVGSPSSRSSIFAAPPHLATPSIIGSYGSLRSSHYGTVGRMRSRSSLARRGSWAVRPDRDAAADEDPDDDDVALGEDQPILVKEVKQGDKFVLAVDGQSTLPQSVFNSINALIGVGLLSLPLALRMSGWLIGLSLLTLMALVATHTGKLLGKCMEVDASIITYSDLAYICFGARARLVISALFTLELIGACVALVILFADSLDLLLPGVASVDVWKCVCAALVLVLNTMPLRWLSYTSVVGIFSTFGIVCIVLVDGLTKRHTPGSLLEPATTHLLPSNWLALPLAYGLLASPWGAHCVFPSIYRDMRFPHQWRTGVNVAFSFSYALDMSLAVVGILISRSTRGHW